MFKRNDWLFIVSVGLLSACGSSPDIQNHSGFLSQYEDLEPLPADKKEQFLGFNASESVLSDYDRLIVNPVALHIPDETLQEWDIEPERYKKLQNYFTNQLNYRMGQHYELTVTPGEGILRLRVAITGEETDLKPTESHQALPLGLLVHDKDQLTTDRDKMLNIYQEGELVDSVTGEQIAVLVGGVQLPPIDIGQLRTLSAVEMKPLVDNWIDAFCRHFPNCQ
ncbi:hypothetical protein GZ77_05520 [Endozoicomonas montiporae]|uniref:Lipoprotein n=2 Tax=Endozoicomonas montiporae TaxID=1027273 RepID=A0A081NBX5_9GAMM|nr:DUF3313 domain-containing protein [Endozoicomonas montiporae]AMO56264.1 putative lipoprotein [Endozoicomonas montiporae CL-33]KEQ15948.1 hypothetical protein GZ77_05520 [Endozoicomonas montiporae]